MLDFIKTTSTTIVRNRESVRAVALKVNEASAIHQSKRRTLNAEWRPLRHLVFGLSVDLVNRSRISRGRSVQNSPLFAMLSGRRLSRDWSVGESHPCRPIKPLFSNVYIFGFIFKEAHEHFVNLVFLFLLIWPQDGVSHEKPANNFQRCNISSRTLAVWQCHLSSSLLGLLAKIKV